MADTPEKWDLVIRAQRGWWDIDLAGIWRYRDLIYLLVRRDFAAFYKQTILGPLWYIINPLFSTGVMTVVFNRVAKIPTDEIPPFLFYMSGTVCWTYFSSCLIKSSNTFLDNKGIFGKVYFPRMIVPISYVIINLYQFIIQFVLFLGLYAFYAYHGMEVEIKGSLILLPLLLFQMAVFGLGVGILVSSFTTKYRDLTYLFTFAVGLWSYATPIIYPASIVPAEHLDYFMLNPMAPIVEQFRNIFFGTSVVELHHIMISWVSTLLILVVGMVMFHRIEKSFVDTV